MLDNKKTNRIYQAAVIDREAFRKIIEDMWRTSSLDHVQRHVVFQWANELEELLK